MLNNFFLTQLKEIRQMDRYEVLRDAVVGAGQLTDTKLRKMIDEFSTDTSELLSALWRMATEIDRQWYALYKITTILKFLCERNPRETLSSLSERTAELRALARYNYVNGFAADLGANVRINAEQLLDFVAEGDKLMDRINLAGTNWSSGLASDAAIDRLLRSLDAVDSVNSEKIVCTLRSDVARVNKYLAAPVTREKYTGVDKHARVEATVYGRLVERIVDCFDDNFPRRDTETDPTIERLLVVRGASFGVFHESLLVLANALKKSTKDKVTGCLVNLLEKLIRSESLYSSIIDACRIDEARPIEREETESKWRSTLQTIVSLPSRVANKLNGDIPDTFLPDTYAKILSFHVIKSIEFFASGLGEFGLEPEVKMISMLLSKAVITLGARRFQTLIDVMSQWCSENSVNLRILVNEILKNFDRSAMEPIAILFLKGNELSRGIVGAFENLLTNPHWKHVLTIKIPLMGYYESDNLVRNLIACLASCDQRILIDLLLRLLDVWSDRSALNHSSPDQHLYVTKLILVAVKKIVGKTTRSEKDEIKRLLFAGTSVHLESTQCELRAVGMITGEIVVETLSDSKDEPRLKYDYEGMPEKARKIVEDLQEIAENRDKSVKIGENDSSIEKSALLGERKILDLGMECGILSPESSEPADSSKITNDLISTEKDILSAFAMVADPDEELDSDDDLVPYDMSNDTPIGEKLRPTYLRDLRDNLLNAKASNDPDVFARSMEAAEDLILSQLPSDDSSFALELLEILLTLRENSYTKNFELLKYRACVAIAIVFPKESAGYLCREFHGKIGDYSIRDRLLILDVLGESAIRLSKIETSSGQPQLEKIKKRTRLGSSGKVSLAIDGSNAKRHETLYDDDFEVSPGPSGTKMDWQEIVDERIESNTRRFAHPTKISSTTINKFNDVASYFFYPLLYGFRREGTCLYQIPKTADDQENIILVNYLKTLSRIMMAAENCIIVPKMAKEMMELAWSLRYHEQAKIRLCVIENIAAIVITLPKQGLTGDMLEMIFEFRAWLSDVSENGVRGDPDTECRNLGKNVIALIDSIFRSTLQEFST